MQDKYWLATVALFWWRVLNLMTSFTSLPSIPFWKNYHRFVLLKIWLFLKEIWRRPKKHLKTTQPRVVGLLWQLVIWQFLLLLHHFYFYWKLPIKSPLWWNGPESRNLGCLGERKTNFPNLFQNVLLTYIFVFLLAFVFVVVFVFVRMSDSLGKTENLFDPS